MEAVLILSLLEERAAQRRAPRYSRDYLHLTLASGETRRFQAQNQVYFLVGDAPAGVRIESENGQYDQDNFSSEVQQHEHSGNIAVTNNSSDVVGVRFYRLLLSR